MLRRLRNAVPPKWLSSYHRAMSWLAAAWYGHPSEKLIVIGVTGTKGKTTTSYLIAKALEASGYPTGCTTTALFKIGQREWINDTKMTMLGRFQLQKMLRDMVKAGCHYAVIETSSQGVSQHRHQDINYDVAVFTNLTPEHLESHGGFENYKRAKIVFFLHVAASKRKTIEDNKLLKTAVINATDLNARDFALPKFDRLVWYAHVSGAGDIVARDIELNAKGVTFSVRGQTFKLQLPGMVNVDNALAAIAVADALDIPLPKVAAALKAVERVPGRFERVDEGQPWTVIVDYAHEPVSLTRLFDAVESMSHKRIIHVVGSAGGGRDAARRPELGRISAEHASIVIVANEDPYDEDPAAIIAQVAEGARAAGKRDGETLFTLSDRREAIRQAMQLAREGDIVLLTGKGSEQAIMLADGKRLPWDEREEARRAIRESRKLKPET